MDIKHTQEKMYHECMNLADGLDVAKFAELVRADEREACAEWLRDNYQDYKNIADICEAMRERGEK